MRAAYYRGGGVFQTGPASMPAAGAGEAILRVRRVGICGTDLHIYQGHLDHRVPRGGIIGHEVFAEVASAPLHSGFAQGDRVTVIPMLSCDACHACRMGANYLCHHLKVLGVDAPGGMQDYWAVPSNRLLKVPDAISEEDAPLLEPLAVAVHDVTRAEIKDGDTVVVFGGGPIGCLIALVSQLRGAQVKVVEINPHRVEMLKRFGLDTLGPETDAVHALKEWTDGRGADVAFEVSGSPDAARVITEVVRVWGAVAVIGIHAEPVLFSLYSLFARELRVHGSRLYTRTAWEQAIQLVASRSIAVAPLVSRVIPLEDLQQGMEAALGGGPVMKVIVDMAAG